MLVGSKLLELRKKRKLTQAELSKLANVPQSAISSIEHDTREPELSTLEKLADALGVNTHFFLDSHVSPPPDHELVTRYMSLTKRQREIIDNLLTEFSASQKGSSSSNPYVHVSGASAAGIPLYDDTVEDAVAIPSK